VVDGLVDIEQKDLSLLLLDDPGLRQIHDAPAIDKHEHPDLLIDACLLDPLFDLGVGGDGVDLVLDVLALEHLLHGEWRTEKILRVQMLSMSTAAKITIDT
jgi:hypothetical protein